MFRALGPWSLRSFWGFWVLGRAKTLGAATTAHSGGSLGRGRRVKCLRRAAAGSGPLDAHLAFSSLAAAAAGGGLLMGSGGWAPSGYTSPNYITDQPNSSYQAEDRWLFL